MKRHTELLAERQGEDSSSLSEASHRAGRRSEITPPAFKSQFSPVGSIFLRVIQPSGFSFPSFYDISPSPRCLDGVSWLSCGGGAKLRGPPADVKVVSESVSVDLRRVLLSPAGSIEAFSCTFLKCCLRKA